VLQNYWNGPYVQTDRLGSVRDLFTSSGIVDHIEYDVFGAITAETNASYGGHYKYTCREYDQSTGLYDYRARYYDPKTGRFIGEDPTRLQSGPNPYEYTWNDASNLIDPTGLSGDIPTPDWLPHIKGIRPGEKIINVYQHDDHPKMPNGEPIPTHLDVNLKDPTTGKIRTIKVDPTPGVREEWEQKDYEKYKLDNAGEHQLEENKRTNRRQEEERRRRNRDERLDEDDGNFQRHHEINWVLVGAAGTVLVGVGVFILWPEPTGKYIAGAAALAGCAVIVASVPPDAAYAAEPQDAQGKSEETFIPPGEGGGGGLGGIGGSGVGPSEGPGSGLDAQTNPDQAQDDNPNVHVLHAYCIETGPDGKPALVPFQGFSPKK
jgi:RHS repeat-associated protein